MARLEVEISEELFGWVQDETTRSKSTKVAFVTGILEAARGGDGEVSEQPVELPAEPDGREESAAIKRLQVTLDKLLKLHLAHHPSRPELTDEEIEILEERWEDISASIGREIAE